MGRHEYQFYSVSVTIHEPIASYWSALVHTGLGLEDERLGGGGFITMVSGVDLGAAWWQPRLLFTEGKRIISREIVCDSVLDL